jgi:hypothetical protein
LGGDELKQAEGCYEEIEKELPDYAVFEASLDDLVKELGFENTIRWERNTNTNATLVKRAGEITQYYWMRSIDDYPPELPSNAFSSASLYMDVNEDDENANKIYSHVRKTFRRNRMALSRVPSN